jgi:hypothetical protein
VRDVDDSFLYLEREQIEQMIYHEETTEQRDKEPEFIAVLCSLVALLLGVENAPIVTACSIAIAIFRQNLCRWRFGK